MIKFTFEKVEGGNVTKCEISGNSMKSWKLLTNLPKDASFRSRDLAVGMLIKGYIIPGYKDNAKENEGSFLLATWAKYPSSQIDAYRKVTLEQITAGITERKIVMNDCYVANYKESFKSDQGDGTFEAEIRVRRVNAQGQLFEITGGFKAEDKK